MPSKIELVGTIEAAKRLKTHRRTFLRIAERIGVTPTKFPGRLFMWTDEQIEAVRTAAEASPMFRNRKSRKL